MAGNEARTRLMNTHKPPSARMAGMTDNVVEFPKARNDTPPLARMICDACGSAEWHLVILRPDLINGELACASCGGLLGEWVETDHEPPGA